MVRKYYSYLYSCHFLSMNIFGYLSGIMWYSNICSVNYVKSEYIWILFHVPFMIFAYHCPPPGDWHNMWCAPNEIIFKTKKCLNKTSFVKTKLCEPIYCWKKYFSSKKKVSLCCTETCFKQISLIKLVCLFKEKSFFFLTIFFLYIFRDPSLLFSSVLHFLFCFLKIYRIVNFFGKIDWSMNSWRRWAEDC